MLYLSRYHWLRYGIWPKVKPFALIALGGFLYWWILGCAAAPEPVQVTPVPVSEFKDPLAIGQKQKESVAGIVDRSGKPEIPFSWAGDDFKVEVLRWKKPGFKYERWAIRINDVYKFTWTQWKEEKK